MYLRSIQRNTTLKKLRNSRPTFICDLPFANLINHIKIKMQAYLALTASANKDNFFLIIYTFLLLNEKMIFYSLTTSAIFIWKKSYKII